MHSYLNSLNFRYCLRLNNINKCLVNKVGMAYMRHLHQNNLLTTKQKPHIACSKQLNFKR